LNESNNKSNKNDLSYPVLNNLSHVNTNINTNNAILLKSPSYLNSVTPIEQPEIKLTPLVIENYMWEKGNDYYKGKENENRKKK